MAKKSLDKQVTDMVADVKARRAKIETLQKPHWITPCSLQLPGHDRLNIQIEKSLPTLAFAIGTLNRMLADTQAAFKELDIEDQVEWQSYSIEDWITDLKLRIKITQIQTEKQKLASIEKRLTPLLSEDQRREMALAELSAELG